MNRGRATLRALLVMAAVVALDQASKAIVRGSLGRGDDEPVFPAITIVNVRNRGVAFGMFADGGAVLVAIGAAAVVALVVFLFLHADRPLAWLPTGMLLGGAAGNLIDRVREGAVTDWIDLPLWPPFNVADMAITFGVLVLLYVLEGPPRRQEHEARAGAAP